MSTIESGIIKGVHANSVVVLENGAKAVVDRIYEVKGIPEIEAQVISTRREMSESLTCEAYFATPIDCSREERIKAMIRDLHNRQHHIPRIREILEERGIEFREKGLNEVVGFINLFIHPMQMDPINRLLPEGISIAESSHRPV